VCLVLFINSSNPMQGVYFEEQAYVWEETLTEKAIAERYERALVRKVIDAAVFLLLGAILLVLIYLLFFEIGLEGEALLLAFMEPSLAGLCGSALLLLGAFVFFRFVTAAEMRAKMPSKPSEAVELEEIPDGVKTINIAHLYQPTAMKAVEDAYTLAMRFGHAQVEPLHLYLGAMSANGPSQVLARLGINFERIKESFNNRLSSRQIADTTQLAPKSEEVLTRAFANSVMQGRKAVSPLEIFAESFIEDDFIKELFFDLGVEGRQFQNAVEWVRILERMRERLQAFNKAAVYKPTGPMNRAMTSVQTPVLDQYSTDLTTQAVRGGTTMLLGRDQEMEDLLRIIEGGRQSVLLVGPEGVGKTSLIHGLADRMVEERVPEILQDKRLVSVSIPHLIAGAGPAEAQERLMGVLIDVAQSRNIVLVLENIEQMTGLSAGGAQTADLTSLLVDFLNRGSTFAIATTTPQAYTQAIEGSSLFGAFQALSITEPDTDEAIHVLESQIPLIEYEQKIVFTYEAVEKAVLLSDRYMHGKYLPQKAIEICREVALQVARMGGKDARVTGEDVARIVSSKTGVPVTRVAEEEKEVLLNLEEKMTGRVIGQDEAVHAVASALKRARAELTAKDRPVATFLFLGSTGVGKTELAKTVADTYFGNEKNMVRVDMSEYQDVSSIHRLIGVPGSNEGGLLSEAVRKQPFSLVLLDELEKAHPDILNIFLQVFDDGRLTDAAGRTVDFTNTIIISTSNAGTQYIQDAIASNVGLEEIKTHLIQEELRGVYRPEFLNRFDGVIVFRPLTLENVQKIAELMIAKVSVRLEPKGIYFRATDEAIKELAQKGFDPQFGARPLRRVVQEEVDNAIAQALLEGKVERRDTIVLDKGGVMTIEKATAL
jgi:ATP-dependent Clp protease ATP-binding subunit ClpC